MTGTEHSLNPLRRRNGLALSLVQGGSDDGSVLEGDLSSLGVLEGECVPEEEESEKEKRRNETRQFRFHDGSRTRLARRDGA